MIPIYNLDKIKFTTDAPTFEKAIVLYEGGKVTQFAEEGEIFSAVVLGTSPYRVWVSAKRYDSAHCDCYLGQNDTLCKHMVAVAIRAITGGKPLSDDDKQNYSEPKCSGRRGEVSPDELALVKKGITDALRYIKPYRGPSRIWFSYQNTLSEGCNRLSKIVSELPVSQQTAQILVELLLRLDEKLCRGGVDDSDGTVGDFMQGVVQVLEEGAKVDPSCINAFHTLVGRSTAFGWEESLVKLVQRNEKT
ncbi:MAG: SWIM zinc finger family protein [Patescibacteria group bacterium]